MKKNLLLMALIFITIISFVFHKKEKLDVPFRCEAQINDDFLNKTPAVKLNSYVTVVFTSHERGFFSLAGSVSQGDKRFILLRDVFFNTSPTGVKNMYKVVFLNENKHPTDSTPDTLWNDVISPQAPGVGVFLNISDEKNNTIFIKGMSNPHLVCVKKK